MSDRNPHELATAYLDGELDVAGSLEFERHLEGCDACKALLDRERQLRDAVQVHAPYFHAPADLEKKIRSRIAATRDLASRDPRRKPFFSRAEFAIAAGILLVIACGLALFELLRPSTTPAIAQQVVGSHIRSLMADHLMDVASSDQHTVKPWFTGKLDFAPSVKDLAADGFPLIGGRLDYVDGHSTAVLVFKRGRHTINLLEWPSSDPDSEIQAFTIRGFHLVHWTRSRMSYWAIADLNETELREFAEYQRR